MLLCYRKTAIQIFTTLAVRNTTAWKPKSSCRANAKILHRTHYMLPNTNKQKGQQKSSKMKCNEVQ
jgi:hypothetical protein